MQLLPAGSCVGQAQRECFCMHTAALRRHRLLAEAQPFWTGSGSVVRVSAVARVSSDGERRGRRATGAGRIGLWTFEREHTLFLCLL